MNQFTNWLWLFNNPRTVGATVRCDDYRRGNYASRIRLRTAGWSAAGGRIYCLSRLTWRPIL